MTCNPTPEPYIPKGRTVCVDFDGVIHSYTSKWQGVTGIPDPPVPGAMDWLVSMIAHFNVCIFSSRSHEAGGRDAMRRWFKEHAPPNCRNLDEFLFFPRYKPPAIIYIDDRGFRFTGSFAELTPAAIWALQKTWQHAENVP